MRWLPLFTVAIGLANAVFIGRLPRAPHDLRGTSGDGRPAPTARARAPAQRRVDAGQPLQRHLWTNQVLLNVVIPLWLVQATDAPHWLLAWLFGTNTVMCIFLPQYTSRSVVDAVRRVALRPHLGRVLRARRA